MSDTNNRRRLVILGLLLSLATLAVYWPVRDFAFLNCDDPDYVTENPRVLSGLTGKGMVWAFTTWRAANWHPLTWLSHMLDVELMGTWAGGHHLTNVFLHLANSVLLLYLLHRMTGRIWRSTFVAALFALHPLHVESVAWIAERKDVLSGLFWMLSLFAYLLYVEKPTTGRYLGLAVAFALGLMAKPMLVTLPFVLLLLDYWPLRRLAQLRTNTSISDNRLIPSAKPNRTGVGLFVEKLPLLLLSAVSSVVTVLAQKHGGAVSSVEAIPITSRLANALTGYLGYIRKAFWPADLAALYPYHGGGSHALVIVCAICLLGMSAMAIWLARRRPWCAVGWFWFTVTLVPVIGLIQVGVQSMADRYTYIPLVGLSIMIVWAVAEFCESWRHARLFCAIAGVAVILPCSFATRVQLSFWRDSETLFRHTLDVTSRNYLAHSNLGSAFLEQGKLAEAEAEFSKALGFRPSHVPALNGMTSVLAQRQDYDAALVFASRALELRADDPSAHYNLALVLAGQSKFTDAVRHYREAIRLNPEFFQAHNNLANLLIQNGKIDDGLAHARLALDLRPDSAQAHFNVANGLFLQSKLPEASEHYLAALATAPDLVDAHLNLAKLLMKSGRMEPAETHLRALTHQQPNHAEAHQLLAAVYHIQKRSREAVREYTEVLRLFPDQPEALNNLAWIQATNPDHQVRNGPDAVRLAERACSLTGGTNAALLATLAAAYAEAGRFTEAINTQLKVCELALAASQPAMVEASRKRLALYRAEQPFREP